MGAQTSVAGAGTATADAPPSDVVSKGTPAWPLLGYIFAGIVALAPALRMAHVVLRGSPLQHNDYWQMLPRFVTPDGALHVKGLFHFQNEHPMVVPQALYWINLRLFSGSNIVLGLIVVTIVLGQLAVIALLLSRSDFEPVERIAVFVLASVLLFDLTGTWNFAKAMSGTAWLSANAFAVTAIYLRSRDRCWLAFGAGALAAISYGTGIVAWVAVIAVGLVRRPARQWWREWPYALAFVLTFVWYRASGPQRDHDLDLSRMVKAAGSMLGFVLGLHGDAARAVGTVAVVGVPVLAIALGVTRRGVAGVAGWIGVALFGWLAIFELAYGRLTLFGEQTRYTSLAALTWIGFVVLVVYAFHAVASVAARRSAPVASAFRSQWLVLVLAVPLAIGALTAGRADRDALLALNRTQVLREIALRLDLTDNTLYLVGPLSEPTHVQAILRGTGSFPFVDSWDRDCGLIGTRLGNAGNAKSEVVGEVRSARPAPRLHGAVEFDGRVLAPTSIRCIVVADDADRVIGAAWIGGDTPGGNAFQALARGTADEYGIYVVLDGSSKPLLLDRVGSDEIRPS
jgi:hypothetical protein